MVSLNYNLLSSNFQTLPFFSENSSDHLQDSLYQDFQDLQHLENVKYCQDFLDSNFDVTLPSNITSKSSFIPSFPLFLFYICISLSAQHTFSFYHLSYIFAQTNFIHMKTTHILQAIHCDKCQIYSTSKSDNFNPFVNLVSCIMWLYFF